MKGGGGDCVTWDDFVHRAFVRPLKRFLEACDTVVLAFDNYAQVGLVVRLRAQPKKLTQVPHRSPLRKA
jgi:hypothetical protein